MQLDASVNIAPQINFYNLRVSHWEPLIDPWDFSILASRNITTGLLAVTLLSRKRLEVNMTSTLIELAMTTMAVIDREGEQAFSKPRGHNAPFRIRNRTGYALTLWNEASEEKGKVETMDHGKEIPWRFEDWKSVREVRQELLPWLRRLSSDTGHRTSVIMSTTRCLSSSITIKLVFRTNGTSFGTSPSTERAKRSML